MRNIISIIKKELRRYLTDKRMLIALFLPGILIFVVYNLFGSFFNTAIADNTVNNYSYNIVETNNYSKKGEERESYFDTVLKESLKEYESEVNITYINKDEVEEYKAKIVDGTYELLVDFDDEFEYKFGDISTRVNVSLFYNGAKNESYFVYSMSNAILDNLYKGYTINVDAKGNPITANLSESDITLTKMFSMIIPMITLTLVCSTCISLAPESIAGEKERGTLGLILITPIKRFELAIGKVISLAIVCLCSGLTSFLGLITSLPKLFSGMNVNATLSLSLGDSVLLFFLIVSVLLLLVTFATFISSFTKSIKEASSYLGPLTMVVILVGILPSIVDVSSIGFSFVPLLSTSYCFSSLILGTINPLYVVISIISNLLFTILFSVLVVKMFNNEDVMFGR